MSQSTITKSIRLTPEESEEVALLSEKRSLSEAALMKRWIQKGILTEKLELALQAYIQDRVDLRGGSAMAAISYNHFMREVQSRNLVVLKEDNFLERLAYWAEVFDNQVLGDVVRKVSAESDEDPFMPSDNQASFVGSTAFS